MDNGEGIDCGLEGWAGWKGAKGKKWDNCNRINNKNTIAGSTLLDPFQSEVVKSKEKTRLLGEM